MFKFPTFILIFLLGMRPAVAATDKIKWLDNWDAAQADAAKECKPLLIEIGAPWCPTCQTMEEGVLARTQFKNLSSQIILLRSNIDLDDGKSLQQRFLAPYIPTYIFLRPDGHEIGRMFGQQPEANFLIRLSSWLKKSREVPCKSSPLKT